MRSSRTEWKRQDEYLAYQPLRPDSRVVEGISALLSPMYQLLSKQGATEGFSNSQRWELAGIFLDFVADLRDKVGLWASYEQYNRQWFGTQLPLTMGNGIYLPEGLHLERIRHLLWVMIPEISGESFLAPDDNALDQLSQAVYTFLNDQFHSLPEENGIKAFLQTPNEYGWDVKRKLVWLGSKSYLFRTFYRQYMEERGGGKADINHTDDFICQECTAWSGLGAIDILTGVLNLRDEEKNDLRGWYQRHAAAFLILSASKEVIVARNIINDQSYTVRMNDDRILFKQGHLVIGSLTPWRGEWYWSGQQRSIEKPTAKLMSDIKETFIRQNPNLVYRYCPEREIQARQRMAEFHAESLKFNGTDLMIYPDGLAMAADWQREMRQKWEAQSSEKIKDVMARHKMKKPCPDISIPQNLLDSNNGVGVFLNPEEGKEIMEQFHDLVAGFQRKGADLTDWQEEVIHSFIRSEALSPAFVLRMIKEYGDESLKSVFRLQGTKENYWLDYLLRRSKGHFYRKRYPAIAVAG